MTDYAEIRPNPERPAIIDLLEEVLGCKCWHTGSMEICNPPPKRWVASPATRRAKTDDFFDAEAFATVPEGSDDDWIVLAPASGRLIAYLWEHDFYPMEGSLDQTVTDAPTIPWFRDRDHVNLITTTDPDVADKWVRATAYCKARNIMDRDERVEIFRAFRRGVMK